MRDKEKQAAKEAAIKADYAAMASDRRYNRVYICDQIGLKYFLKSTTVERIVWGEYETRRKRDAERQQSGQRPMAAA